MGFHQLRPDDIWKDHIIWTDEVRLMASLAMERFNHQLETTGGGAMLLRIDG